MPISTSVRFTGGPLPPAEPCLDPSPGLEIALHLVAALPPLGVEVLGHEDLEYAHELRCRVGGRPYVVSVAYDWLDAGWWEVFWSRRLGLWRRLLGQSEATELRFLALAMASALERLPGIGERRWYPDLEAGTSPGAVYSVAPILD